MAEWFLNPYAMLAGLLAVALPVVIHLINRVRYKRVRWAAMEFLLKAQKRVRRKMILQQLLLLLSRMLLMLLAGLLLARFLGFGLSDEETRATAHAVVLDDTPSMADGWRADDGTQASAFESAKRVVVEQIAKSAAEATTPQSLTLYRLSDLAHPISVDRLNDTTIARLAADLKSLAPSMVRVPLRDGLKAAQAALAELPGDTAKVAHLVSDFRALDWSEGADGLKEVSGELSAAKVKLNLVDVAHPARKRDDRRAPLSHDNLAITELRPAKLTVARYEPLEFTLRVKNFGAAELKSLRFSIRVNGDENKGRSVAIDTLPGFQERAVKFEVSFDRLGTEAMPLDRFSLVTAVLETPEPGGLAADNVRHAVVEVRERLPILVVEGRPNLRESKDGDGFYLRPVFTAVLGGYSWVDGTAADLETLDLSKFAFVLLLNVPTLPEAAVKAVESYARAGGGVGLFLGPDVRPADYNQLLYRNGEGIMPAALQDKPSPELTEDELQARRFRISQKKLLVRDPAFRSHPALAGLYTDERGEPVKDAEQLERVFGFLSIKRYWPLQRLGRGLSERGVTELYVMPNDRAMADYEAAARKVADALPADDGAHAKFAEPLAKARDELRRLAISADPLYRLAAALDDLLADQRGYGDPSEALLREFWADPKQADLKREASRLRDAVKFGDPFYLARDFGNGRVTLVTTTAGETWTDWPAERPGSASFAPVMKEMASYLSGAGTAANRTLGEPIVLTLDAERTKPTVGRAFLTHVPKSGGGNDPNPAPITDLKDQALTPAAGKLVLDFRDAREPGAYLFTLTGVKPQAAGGEGATAPEYRGFAVNIDAEREGDLRRAARDDVTLTAAGAPLNAADDPEWAKALRNKSGDLSESVWMVLGIGLLLLFEQYMATRLSFNTASDATNSDATKAALRGRTAAVPATTA
jgi:hypothetical protein